MSRRSFVASLGMAVLAAPFVGYVTGGRSAAAAAPTKAKRFVVFFTPNGTVPARWRPTGGETSFSFPAGSILEPIASWKDRLVILDELDFANANNHEGGMAAMLTGGVGGASGGTSIDQLLAATIGSSTRLRSLELGVQTSAWGGSQQTRMSYAGPSRFVPPDDSPKNVFDRVYGAAVPSGNDGDAVAAAARRRKQSVIDAVRADLGELRGRLGGEEARKLDQHVESIRDLERSLGLGGGGGGTGTGTCERGAAVADLPIYANDNFPAIGTAQMDLLVASLACGVTNVASIQWAHTVAPHVFTWLGLSESHHGLSHNSDVNAAGVDNFVKAERWFSEQFGYLLSKLDATPDPAGGTLLDSTMVLWCKEMGDSREHVCTNVPMVIAGAGFTPGRYLRNGGASHARMLLSICRAFGLDTASFGDPATGSAPLAGL